MVDSMLIHNSIQCNFENSSSYLLAIIAWFPCSHSGSPKQAVLRVNNFLLSLGNWYSLKHRQWLERLKFRIVCVSRQDNIPILGIVRLCYTRVRYIDVFLPRCLDQFDVSIFIDVSYVSSTYTILLNAHTYSYDLMLRIYTVCARQRDT